MRPAGQKRTRGEDTSAKGVFFTPARIQEKYLFIKSVITTQIKIGAPIRLKIA
jgi:hypothetical protein